MNLSARFLHGYGTLKRSKGEVSILVVAGAFLGVFVVFPLLLLVLNSFRDIGLGEIGLAFDKLTLGNYSIAYMNPRTWKMLWDSLVFAGGAAVVAFLLGGGMAFITERTNAPFRHLTYGLMFVPLIVPGMLLSIGWIFLLSPKIGLLNKAWMSIGFHTPFLDVYSMPVMWWIQGVMESPLTFLMLGAAFRRMDPSLEEAAIACGTSRVNCAIRITLKLMLPAIAGVALLQFVRGLEAMEVPLILGLNSGIKVFSVNILLSLQEVSPPDYALGFTYGISLICLTVAGLFIYLRMMRQSEKYVVVTGKGYRPGIINLGKWKFAAAGFQIFFGVAAIGLPLLVLIWVSLLRSYEVPSIEMLSQMNLDKYTSIIGRPGMTSVILNTVVVAAIASVCVMFLSILLSWIVFHMKIKGGAILDGLAFIPYAIPSIAMAIAFMVLFLSFRNPIYGTIWILVIAYVIRFMPYGTRFTHAGLLQIKKELEEVALTAGASYWKMFLRIIIPIMKPSLVGGGLYVFILSVKIFPIAALLSSPNSKVLAVEIWQMWNVGMFGEVSALAVMMIGGLSILTLLVGTRTLGQITG
ncbi:MAG: iron ABC transporter permease [Chloroflexi bacterium]|nr:iron ABC transporter permease [Chloroflexota bacterium]